MVTAFGDIQTAVKTIKFGAYDFVEKPFNMETEVRWLHSYAVLGPYDYLDIFEAPDVAAAMRVATLIRTFGHAECEVWPATAWEAFKEMLHELPREAGEHVPAVAAL